MFFGGCLWSYILALLFLTSLHCFPKGGKMFNSVALPSAFALLVAMFSPLHANPGMPIGIQTSVLSSSENTTPEFPLGQFLFTLSAESGNALSIFSNDVVVVENEDGTPSVETILGFQFEDGTSILSKITILPDGRIETDSSYDYFQLLMESRSDLLPLFENFRNGMIGSPSGKVNPNQDSVVLGFWSWVWENRCALSIATAAVELAFFPVTIIGWGGTMFTVISNCYESNPNAV